MDIPDILIISIVITLFAVLENFLGDELVDSFKDKEYGTAAAFLFVMLGLMFVALLIITMLVAPIGAWA